MAGEDLVHYTLDAHPGIPPLPRADLYRELTRNIQREILEVAFPRTRKILGKEGLEELLEAFLSDGEPTTLQYPCVPDNVVDWARKVTWPYADLLDFERLSVRAERHPARIDSLLVPQDRDLLGLNPTLQVATYERPVHEISGDNPDPPRSDSPFVYLAWRRPLSDDVARHRLGAQIGRALGGLGEKPMTREQWVQQSLARSAVHDGEVLAKALNETFEALVERSGIVAVSP